MPLQDELPVIDDRTFAEIVDEARSRIPRYTPEWTDLNESDPGMAMVQLFAWLTEMQIYRMSLVPKLNYLKFLELVGIELEPAKPSTARIAFTVLDNFNEDRTIVPSHTQVATEDPDEQGPIIFETDSALIAIKAKLDRLQVFDGVNYRDISNENDDENIEVSFEPFGTPNVGRALLLGFDTELPETTISLTGWVPAEDGKGAVLQCVSDGLQVSISAELTWEYWNGYEWRKLDVLKDDTAGFSRSGEVQLKGPAKGQMVPIVIGKVEEERYWIRARVSKAGYEVPPRLLALRTNIVAATQAETIEFEIVDGSNGQIDQEVTLSDAPVISGSLELQVDEGAEAGFETWTEVPDLFGSGLDDNHYVLNRATGVIRFGDGINGRIPIANPRRPANMRARKYRVGGGTRGNVPAKSLVVLQSSVEGVDPNGVINLFASAGGVEEQSLTDAIARAPQTLKSKDRAVTSADFEELAMRSANIARAKALPLYHPKFRQGGGELEALCHQAPLSESQSRSQVNPPGIEIPGVVTVIVIPKVDTKKNSTPTPSQGTLQTVCAYLNERRLLTTEVYVIGPVYREVKISAVLIAEDSADLAAVKTAALDSIQLYFDPIEGGEGSSRDKPGPGWPFGGTVYYSLLYRRVLLAGVKRIASLTVSLDGEEHEPCTDVLIEPGALLGNGEHEIEVRYE